MSIPVYENGKPDYRNMSQFPRNIYDNEKVMPLAYFKRDLLPTTTFEFIVGQNEPWYEKNGINPNIAARYSWGQFSNGYGYGNLQGSNNTFPGCGAFQSCNPNVKPQKLITNQKYDKKCFPFCPFESTPNKFIPGGLQSAIDCDSPQGLNGVEFVSKKTMAVANAYANSLYYK